MDLAFFSDFLSNASILMDALDFFSGSADALSETPETTPTT